MSFGADAMLVKFIKNILSQGATRKDRKFLVIRHVYNILQKNKNQIFILRVLRHLRSKPCTFTNYAMFFQTVVIDFFVFVKIKVWPNMEIRY